MPALSPTMEEGKLARWLVKEGDTVKSGDVLAEIETDKATMEFEAVDEGRIGKLLVPEGAEGVKVNAPIAVLLGEGEDAGAVKAAPAAAPAPKAEAPKPAAAPAPQAVAPKPAAPAPAAPAPKPAAPGARIFASPLARRIAAEKGIDLSAVLGSGPHGRIIRADIENAKPGAAPVARPAVSAPAGEAGIAGVTPLPDARMYYKQGEYEEIPHDSMRKTIARRLTSAKTLIPHFYLTVDCDLTALMAARARLNERSPKGDGAYKLSVNDFVVKASAMALIKNPGVNASWTDNAILRHRHADIGVAVALDFGLITPIVFAAETKGLAEISREVKELAEAARNKKLKPQQYEGGGFSISNLGMYGIRNFTAVINPPQACILAVGAGEERAVVRNGKVEVANIMTVTMSCDHRVVDGALGAVFLQSFKGFIEEPASMLL
jgi:pyruvate dehydrogenase E2 component (dihydrolipoamide acetyltransferase)